MSTSNFTLISTNRAELGEGITYVKPYLLWVDIEGRKIFRHDLTLGATTEWDLTTNLTASVKTTSILGDNTEKIIPGKPTLILPTSRQNIYLITLSQEIYLWDSTQNLLVERLWSNTNLLDTSWRFNDGKLNPDGKLWIGTLDHFDRPNRSCLYQLDDNQLKPLISPVSLSNGLDWNGEWFYYVDTPERKVQVYRWKNLNHLVYTIDLSKYNGVPDGLTVHHHIIYVAMWDGSQILKIVPTINTIKGLEQVYHIHSIRTPVSRPTNCVVIDDQLYLTSAKVDGEILSGHLLRFNLDQKI